MDKAEKAIRNALLKIDASDKAIRKQIYKTAWEAHERSLKANIQFNKAERIKKRDDLRNIIHIIEVGFHSDHRSDDDSPEHDISHSYKEVKSVTDLNHSVQEEAENTTSQAVQNIKIDTDKIKIQTPLPQKNKRPFIIKASLLFVGIPLFVGIALLVWYFYKNSIVNDNNLNQNSISSIIATAPSLQSDTNETQNLLSDTPVAPVNNQNLDFANNINGFINILTPKNASNVATVGSASINLRNENGVPYLRIYANSAEDAAIINIGEGALNNVRGKNILLDIDAKSEGEQATQMSITCDLGQYNNCGRRRFNVPRYRNDIILQIYIPADSKGPAKLYLTSDVFGEGHAINIYALRFKPVE